MKYKILTQYGVALADRQTQAIHRAACAAGLRLDTIDDPDCVLRIHTTTPAISLLNTRYVNVVVGNPLRPANQGYGDLVASWLPDEFDRDWMDKTLVFLAPKILLAHERLRQRRMAVARSKALRLRLRSNSK